MSSSSSAPASPTPISYNPQNIVGYLRSSDSSAPTIAFVAHYDTHAVFPGLATGADSNGSGIVMLLELLAVLRRFYDKPETRPRYNLAFVWTAAGKFNYQGARQWIDDYSNSPTWRDSKLELAICVDTVGSAGDLHMHASKQPADDSAAARLLRRLRSASSNRTVELVTKRISLSAPMLSWEHERFNVRRMPAVTLSKLPTAEEGPRRTVLDNSISLDALEENIRLVAEALLSQLLSLPEEGLVKDPRVTADASLVPREAIDRNRLAHLIRTLASKPRPVAEQRTTEAIAANIAAVARHYASEVSIHPVSLQEAQVWPVLQDKLVAERVKPAVFELFIAGGVFVYLSGLYYAMLHAQQFLESAYTKLRKAN